MKIVHTAAILGSQNYRLIEKLVEIKRRLFLLKVLNF